MRLSDDAELRLLQHIDRTLPGGLHFAPLDPTDLPAKNAAQELEHLHRTTALEALDIRNALFRHLDTVAEHFQSFTEATAPTDRALAEHRLHHLFD